MPLWKRHRPRSPSNPSQPANLPATHLDDPETQVASDEVGPPLSSGMKKADQLLIEIGCHAARTLRSCAPERAHVGDGARREQRVDEGAAGPLIIVCGFAAEAKIARGPGIIVVQGGGDSERLAAELQAVATGARAIVSFGVAGGIKPGLKPGDVWIADAILAPDGTRFETDTAWSAAIARDLQMPFGTFIGVNTILGGKAEKAAAYLATGAVAVDMESHIVADFAARHNLQFAAIRVVTDAAERSLPHAATVGMRSDGKIDLAAIFASLARNPAQLPSLVRTGLDARAAFASLLRCREGLGPRFALVDL